MENIGVFDFVAGISPWWWVAFALALGAIEMATMSFFLIWPALAALVMAVIVAMVPDMSGEAILALFAAVAIALTFAGRALVLRFGDGGGPETNLNNRSSALVGRRATVLEWDGGRGNVEIDGMRWAAVWDDTAPAETDGRVKVTAADGMTLHVQNVTG